MYSVRDNLSKFNPYFWLVSLHYSMFVGLNFYKLSLARILVFMPESYSLFPYFLKNHNRNIFLISLLFVVLLNPFDPYSLLGLSLLCF